MSHDDVSELVKPHLKRKERLVWAGRPSPEAFGSPGGGCSLGFGLVALGFLGFLFYQVSGPALASNAPWSLALVGVCLLPFVLAIVSFMRGPQLDHQQGARLVYAVTNRRALLIRQGDPPTVKAFRASDFTRFKVEKDRILFAGDAGLDGFMPYHRGTPETTVGPIGFVGLEKRTIKEVRGHLEALRTAEPDERDETEALDSRRSAQMHRIFEFGSTYASVREQLEAWARQQADTEASRKSKLTSGWIKGVIGLGGVALIGLVGLAVLGGNPRLIGETLPVLVPAFLGLAVLALVVQHIAETFVPSRVRTRSQAFTLLDRLAGDRHPDTRLYGWLDVGEVRDVRPVRMKESPHSGSIKSYHKHHWARFVLALADGNLLALSLIDKVKLKAGTLVSRRHFMHGRLSVNPSHYDTARLTEPFTAGSLTAVPQWVGDRVVIHFGGELAQPSEMAEQLAALYRALPVNA